MCIRTFLVGTIITFVLCGVVDTRYNSIAFGNNVIYVPVDSSRDYWKGSYRFTKPISVIDQKGVKHILKTASLEDTLDSDEARNIDFSRDEANVVFELTTQGGYKSRKNLENDRSASFKMYVPISKIKEIAFLPEKKAHMFYPRDPKIEPFIAEFAYGGRPRFIVGIEDLGEFGQGSFKEPIDSLQKIELPELPPEKIASQSTLSAIVTEVGGMQHELKDIRISTSFYKGETLFQLDVNKIETIVVKDASDRGRVQSTVRLKSGAEQDYEWFFGSVGGKGTHWYELIDAEHIASVRLNP